MKIDMSVVYFDTEFDPVRDFQDIVMPSVPMTPKLRRTVLQVYQRVFDYDYIDFMQTAINDVALLFECAYGEADNLAPTAGEFSFAELPHIWAEGQLATLH
jgi:hypothetical protein